MKKEVQIYILELLTLCKSKFNKSNFQIGEDGRLWLWLQIEDVWQSIIFDENYEDKKPSIVFDEILDNLIEGGYNINK